MGTSVEPSRPLSCVHYLTAVNEEHGGVVRAVLDVVAALAKAGHPTTLLTHDSTDCPSAWKSGDESDIPRVVELSPLSKYAKRIRPEDIATIRETLNTAELVHLHTPWAPSNLQVGKIAESLGKPYVVTLHGMLDDWCIAQRRLKKRLFLKLGGRRLLEHAAVVHCTAEGERLQSQKHCPRATFGVAPCLIDIADYQELPGKELALAQFPELSQPGSNLLFLSRVDPKKGVERLLTAAAKLLEQHPDLKLWIAGPGEAYYLGTLLQKAKELGIAKRTHFVGMVRDSLKLSLYQAADIFVLPTSQENFGFVSVEAMLCETPVVTTKGVDIWQELEAGGAVITKSIDSEAVAEAIASLLSVPENLPARGKRSRLSVLDWLDPGKVLNQMAAIYRQAIDSTEVSARQP